KRTLFGHQRIWMGALALLAAFCLTLYPQATLIAGLCVINVFYLGTMLFKLLLFMIGLRQNKWHHTQDRIITPNRASKLPIYTLLVPLYRERESVPRMISAIRALEYPKSRLDVKLIVEADDDETIQAIKDARPPGYFELIRVPYSLPRTKPKACNYALKFARGEYVTIYDAEDQPAPNQLRQALRAFEKAPDNVVCLQAKLNYYNRLERPITQLFAIEYSALFDFTLPGLENLGMPIPLGGTSNHIHLQKLREVGAWDPYNVTEDADLGIRLWLHGYRTRVLGSITLEEAPITLGAWIRQRSRWIKGYMQTWLVYMRNPLELLQTVGWKAFMGFQLFIGGPCLVFLLAPFLWGLCAVWLAGGLPESFIPDWLVASCIAVLAVGLASHVLYALAIARIHQWFGMTAGIALYPLYWLLHSVASFKALWQLIRRPHYWEKTRHATTQLPAHQIMAAMRSHPEGQ
ncbi:MAG: glycosyl transferase, partial [Rickettsiales bacterium]|nr:glycosyl transferase [Rickettsiales bacterium]